MPHSDGIDRRPEGIVRRVVRAGRFTRAEGWLGREHLDNAPSIIDTPTPVRIDVALIAVALIAAPQAAMLAPAVKNAATSATAPTTICRTPELLAPS